LFETGEKSSATVPSYYFTKPLGKGMKNLLQDNSQPSPPSSTSNPYGTRNSTRADLFNNDNIDDEVVPKIRMIVKKVMLKRSKSGGPKSPWCKPTKRRYKKVIIYLDEFGNEIPQDNKDENKEGDNEDDQEGEDDDVEVDNEVSIPDTEEAKEADKENINDNDCEMGDNATGMTRSPRGRRRGDSSRTKSNSVSPRVGRSPRSEKSPVNSIERSCHSPRDRSKSDDRVKSGDETPKSKERKGESNTSETTTKNRVCRHCDIIQEKKTGNLI
jgi:hypothetical protein